MKPISNMEAALMRPLRFRADLHKLAIRVERPCTGGVALLQDGLCLGTWRWSPNEFTFQPESAGRPVTAHTIMGAAALTVSMLVDEH